LVKTPARTAFSSVRAVSAGAAKCRRWCPEDRSFERKPLFEFTLRSAAEIRHRTGDAVEEPDWPTIPVDGTGRHWSHGHNDVDVGIDNIHVDA
jgi:hypothetical protein